MNDEIRNNLYRLNDLNDKYEYYMVNVDNIYYWACEKYNTKKPNSKQLNSICEYPQNYRDYVKITDNLLLKMKQIMQLFPVEYSVEYDGEYYRLRKTDPDSLQAKKNIKKMISEVQ